MPQENPTDVSENPQSPEQLQAQIEALAERVLKHIPLTGTFPSHPQLKLTRSNDFAGFQGIHLGVGGKTYVYIQRNNRMNTVNAVHVLDSLPTEVNIGKSTGFGSELILLEKLVTRATSGTADTKGDAIREPLESLGIGPRTTTEERKALAKKQLEVTVKFLERVLSMIEGRPATAGDITDQSVAARNDIAGAGLGEALVGEIVD